MKAIAAETTSKTDWARTRAGEYATSKDFCLIFSQNVEAFYTLALALTADHAKAEECFVSALEACHKSNGSVFKNWAHSWSRLAVIDSAIRLMKPKFHSQDAMAKIANGVHPEAENVFKLKTFERFVYVLTVLDKYSVRDCAILLRATPQEIRRAQLKALETMAANVAPIVTEHGSTMAARISA